MNEREAPAPQMTLNPMFYVERKKSGEVTLHGKERATGDEVIVVGVTTGYAAYALRGYHPTTGRPERKPPVSIDVAQLKAERIRLQKLIEATDVLIADIESLMEEKDIVETTAEAQEIIAKQEAA